MTSRKGLLSGVRVGVAKAGNHVGREVTHDMSMMGCIWESSAVFYRDDVSRIDWPR